MSPAPTRSSHSRGSRNHARQTVPRPHEDARRGQDGRPRSGRYPVPCPRQQGDARSHHGIPHSSRAVNRTRRSVQASSSQAPSHGATRKVRSPVTVFIFYQAPSETRRFSPAYLHHHGDGLPIDTSDVRYQPLQVSHHAKPLGPTKRARRKGTRAPHPPQIFYSRQPTDHLR